MNLKLSDASNLVWCNKQYPTRIKNMDIHHIRNTIRVLEGHTKADSFNGLTSQEWILAFKAEISRRDRLGEAILRRFPKMWNEYKRTVGSKQPRKTLTTRGVKA